MNRRSDSHDGALSPGEFRARPLDLSKVVTRSRNMLDPELIVAWNTYVGKLTALGSRLLTGLAVDLGKGARPPELSLSEMPASPNDLAAQPGTARGPDTIQITWPGKGEPTRLDVTKLILSGRITVPHGHLGYIPLTRQPVDGLVGDALVLNISMIRYAPVIKLRSKKDAGTTETTAVTAPDRAEGAPSGTPRADGAQPGSGNI